MMLKWVRGFVTGISLGVIAFLVGLIAVEYAIIQGYNDGLKSSKKRSNI